MIKLLTAQQAFETNILLETSKWACDVRKVLQLVQQQLVDNGSVNEEIRYYVNVDTIHPEARRILMQLGYTCIKFTNPTSGKLAWNVGWDVH